LKWNRLVAQASAPNSNGREALRHSERFRKVSNRYPRRVAEAYGGDLERAAAASDEEVAATVAAWEKAQGLRVRDWRMIGEIERGLHEGVDEWSPSSSRRQWFGGEAS
jgi:hypothetical protein